MTREGNIPKLKAIFVLFRHGDRTPTSTYPNDPHINYPWPGGNEALTNKGKKQIYNLGVILRQKYHNLLPEDGNYSSNDIYIRSSYAERCIMSAQCFMAGFLPPSNNDNPLPIEWQPISIDIIPREMDHVIAQSRTCKNYDKHLEEVKKQNITQYKEIFEFLSQHTGWDIKDVVQVHQLYSVLEIQSDAGLKLPTWTERIYPDELLPVAEEALKLYTKTPFMKKVRGGSFLTEIVKYMNAKYNGTLNPDRKVFLYSGHDLTIVSVLNSLNVLEQATKLPDYASAIVFEFYQNDLEQTEIKIYFYRNGGDDNPTEIFIPEINYPCTLEKFNEILEPLIVENFDELCEN